MIRGPLRLLLWAAPVLALGMICALGVIAGFVALAPVAQASTTTCLPTVGPVEASGGTNRGQADAAALDGEQRGIAGAIIGIGQQRQLPPRAWQIAIQAGMTESGLRNLPYGDRDSLGIFQMRPSMGWGSPAQLQDVAYQINKFYAVLLTVPRWESMRPGDAAQVVERSAFPGRYHRWEAMAVYLLGSVGVENASGCSPSVLPPASEIAARAIEFALAQRGKPYVWGATGPDAYDCSGLTLRAYEAAGISLPRVSRDQWRAGAHLPVQQAQPGDLLFWAHDPSRPDDTIHHVAIYLGGNQVVEAQQSGVPVHTRSVSFGEDGLMPLAVRPGAVAA